MYTLIISWYKYISLIRFLTCQIPENTMFWNKEHQYSNFWFMHFRFPTFRILEIVCVQIRNCACSNFRFSTFQIPKILCPIFSIKEHHIFWFSIRQDLICDISDLGSFVFSNKEMSKFLFLDSDAHLLKTRKLRFWVFILFSHNLFLGHVPPYFKICL